MALKVRQKKVCVDIALYVMIQRLASMDLSLLSEDENEVVEALVEFADDKVSKYAVIPDGDIPDIVAYVKEHY